MYPSQAEWCAGTGWRTGESTLFLARFSAMPGPLLVARAVQVLLEEFSSVGSPVGQGAHIHWPRAQVPGLARWRRARLASRHSRQGAHRSPRVWCLVSGVLGSVRPAVVGDLARSACWKWLPLIADTRAYRYLPDSASLGRGQQTSRRIRDGRYGVELAADGGGPGTSQPAWAPSLATRDRGWNGRKTPGDAQPTPSATLATRATLATAPPLAAVPAQAVSLSHLLGTSPTC
ncbi:hypothetical protein ACCO45_002325 [Purpureocillium lilacinum]|uniref:Uncharacterized protein n=1 Tax=Purpureocillium lilacinum TaxID=33203 RepID=A0ACC4EBX2_PURLI